MFLYQNNYWLIRYFTSFLEVHSNIFDDDDDDDDDDELNIYKYICCKKKMSVRNNLVPCLG